MTPYQMPLSYMPVHVSSGHLDELAVLELQRLEQHAHPHFLHPLFLIAVNICRQVSTPLLDSVPMLCDQTRHSFHTVDNRFLLNEGISVCYQTTTDHSATTFHTVDNRSLLNEGISVCYQTTTNHSATTLRRVDNRSLLEEGISVSSARRVTRPLQITQLVLFSVFLTVGNHG